MRPGYFNQYIELEIEKDDEWQLFSQALANIEIVYNKNRIGHELVIDKRVVNTNFYEVTMRYYSGVDCNMRVKWREQAFNILKVFDPNNKQKFLKLVIEKEV